MIDRDLLRHGMKRRRSWETGREGQDLPKMDRLAMEPVMQRTAVTVAAERHDRVTRRDQSWRRYLVPKSRMMSTIRRPFPGLRLLAHPTRI